MRELEIRVLSLNAWYLPWPVARDTGERLEALSRRLPGLDLDVAAFQEVWTDRARDALVAAGRAAGLHAVDLDPTECGGLLVLSRLPVSGARFHPFALQGLPQRPDHGDYYGGKGFLEVELRTAVGPVTVFDTHLQARYGRHRHRPAYESHQAAQLVELAHAMRRTPHPLLLAGDLNVADDTPHYRMLRELSGAVDVAAELNHRQATALPANPYRDSRRRAGRRIDYVFVRDGESAGVAPLEVARVLDDRLSWDGRVGAYSDHEGVLARVVVGHPPRLARAATPAAISLAHDLLDAGRSEARERRSGHRGVAGGALAAVAVGAVAAPRVKLPRRRVLRGLALGVPLLFAGGVGGLSAALSEGFAPGELDAYDRVSALLRDWQPIGPDGPATA